MNLSGPITIRAATTEDAGELAFLINCAGHGLPLYSWTKMAEPGEDPWKTGRDRAARNSGDFSWRNGVVAMVEEKVAGAMIGYPLAADSGSASTSDAPTMFVPLIELENLAAGSWYVMAVAAFPEARGLGIGTLLMQTAEQNAVEQGLRGTALIVSDANVGARRLYEKLGYMEVARRPMIKKDWPGDGENWILMEKPLAA